MTDLVEDKVLEILQKLSRHETLITLDTALVDLNIDSLTTIEAIFEIERDLSIVIPEQAQALANEFVSVRDICIAAQAALDEKANAQAS